MRLLKKCINVLVMLSLIMAAAPAIAQTHSAHDAHGKVAHSQHDCHTKQAASHSHEKHSAEKSDRKEHCASDSSCCDKTCRCMTSACHGGPLLGWEGSNSLFPIPVVKPFLIYQQTVVSGFIDRIIRPPRA